MPQTKSPRRTRVERGIYRQPSGKYAVCARRDGVLRFRTAGYDLGKARLQRIELVRSPKEGRVPASPRLRFDTVAGRLAGPLRSEGRRRRAACGSPSFSG